VRRASLEIPPGETPSTRTDIENLVSFPRNTTTLIVNFPTGIALDLVHGKMYWTLITATPAGNPPRKIQRANLDGSNIEDLVVMMLADQTASLYAIALDVANDKMYWTEVDDRMLGLSKIHRADLDGSNVEDLVTGVLRSPLGIALQLDTSIQVAIDIKPRKFPNYINPQSKGVIPVAILTTAIFNATIVDSNTVFFGATGTEAAPVRSALKDVDQDGSDDLLLHFKTRSTGIQCGDTRAFLTGETFSKQTIEGSDSIKTVGCRRK
jgi:hypothetical protein